MIPTVPEGEHVMTVVAFDTAGNSTAEMVSTTVDLSNPVINYTAPTKESNQNINDTTIQIVDDIAIDISGISASGGDILCTQTSEKIIDCTTIVSTSGTLTITAVDLAGNTSVLDIEDYIIDLNLPVITINAPTKTSATTITDTTITITDDHLINITDVNATGGVIVCVQTTQVQINCSASISESGDLTINATDASGNTVNKTETGYRITTGAPAPFTPTLNTDFITKDTRPIVYYQTTDPSGISHYEVSVDGNEFSREQSPYQLEELAEGFHTILVRAFANSGNFRDGIVNVIIDLTIPVSVNISLNVDSPTNNTRPIIYFNAQDTYGIKYYEVKVESEAGEFSIQNSPYQVPEALEDGEHKVTVIAYDNAGNSIEDYEEFMVDTVPPSGSISINGDQNITLDKKVSLNISAADDRSGIYQMIISENADFNGTQYEPYAINKEWILSNEVGNKTIYIKFKDEAGNESQVYFDTITYSFNINVEESISPLEALENIRDAITEFSREEIPAVLIGTTIISIAANSIVFPNILTYGIFLIRFRNKKKTWGIIYDSSTLKPVPFVTVRLFTKNNEYITQRVTDIDGRYGFVLNQGKYLLEVKHNDYVSVMDTISFSETEGLFVKDIGLISTTKAKSRVRLNLRKIMITINRLFVFIGFGASLIAFVFNPSFINVFILLLYIIQYLVFRHLVHRKQELGYVYNSKTKEKIKGAFVRLYDTKVTRQIEVVITDVNGRYNFNRIPDGEYLISVYANGYKFPSEDNKNIIYTGVNGEKFIKIGIKKGKTINISIPLDPSDTPMSKSFGS